MEQKSQLILFVFNLKKNLPVAKKYIFMEVEKEII